MARSFLAVAACAGLTAWQLRHGQPLCFDCLQRPDIPSPAILQNIAVFYWMVHFPGRAAPSVSTFIHILTWDECWGHFAGRYFMSGRPQCGVLWKMSIRESEKEWPKDERGYGWAVWQIWSEKGDEFLHGNLGH